MQAPVPYLNRALAEEQLGVDADEHDEHQEAQVQYSGAVKVGLCCMYQCTCSCIHSALVTWNLAYKIAVSTKLHYVQIAICTGCTVRTVESCTSFTGYIIALRTALHCIQIALCTNGTVYKWYCVQHCTVYKTALCTKLHCMQNCTLHCIQNCTVYNIARCTKLHCVQHCSVYKTALCTKLHYVGCGCFRGPSLSYSRTSTLPDSSTCAAATQLSTARVLCST